jgi:hypothetical protein
MSDWPSQCVGDWIETRQAPHQGYLTVAGVLAVITAAGGVVAPVAVLGLMEYQRRASIHSESG